MPDSLPPFPKIPHYLRSADLLHAVRGVVCLEKLDGANTRVRIPRGATDASQILVGSRTRLLGERNGYGLPLRDIFLADEAAVAACLAYSAEIDAEIVLYGETIGRGLQAQSYRYGPPRFVLFAARVDGAWLSFHSRLRLPGPSFAERPSVREVASRIGLASAPVLYQGPPDESVFDGLVLQSSAFARGAGRGEVQQEGIVIWSDPLLFDGAGLPLVAKLKDPKRAEILDKDLDGIESPERFAERVVQLERLRHARQHLAQSGRWPPPWGGRVGLLVARVIQDVAREVPDYQQLLLHHSKRSVRSALGARTCALLPALDAEEEPL